MTKDSLSNRMKCYENVNRNYLTRRVPVIIRIDGKAFHTFTRGFRKPFDEILVKSMQETTKYLCENIQGCVLGYTQSDEITLVLIDYMNKDTDAWFGYNVQKMASISSSMATMKFNQIFNHYIDEYWCIDDDYWFNQHYNLMENGIPQYHDRLAKASEKGAMFDSRCFNIPKEEVCNCILWRQNDAVRNSIESVGQANFSQNRLNKKSCNDIKDMLIKEKGIDWNNYPTHLKRGSCCIKVPTETISNGNTVIRNKWTIDNDIPIFIGEGTEYINKLVFI